MKTEKQLQVYLKDRAKANDVLFFKLHCEGQRGFPDVLLVGREGRMRFVELKSPSGTGRLSRLQIETIYKLEERDVHVHVIDSREGCDEVIERLTD